MLTEEEKKFVAWWARERLKKKVVFRKLAVGLPMAVGIVIAVLASTLSGWYQRADMVLRTNSSMIIMILIAVVAIVLFIGLFSIHHQWDQHEQRYQQFLQKEKEDAAHLINNQS